MIICNLDEPLKKSFGLILALLIVISCSNCYLLVKTNGPASKARHLQMQDTKHQVSELKLRGKSGFGNGHSFKFF